MRKPPPPELHRTLRLPPKVAQSLRESAAMVQHLDKVTMRRPQGQQ